jgi:hypothetical protein
VDRQRGRIGAGAWGHKDQLCQPPKAGGDGNSSQGSGVPPELRPSQGRGRGLLKVSKTPRVAWIIEGQCLKVVEPLGTLVTLGEAGGARRGGGR